VVIDQIDDVVTSSAEFASAQDVSGEYYAVQLGNFTDRDNAEALIQIVTDAGHEAAIDELTDQDPVRFRVLSGHHASQASAEAFVESLNRDTGHYGFVVKLNEPAD
jgi:cell division septation protein DedD